jgi:hypothetical protein
VEIHISASDFQPPNGPRRALRAAHFQKRNRVRWLSIRSCPPRSAKIAPSNARASFGQGLLHRHLRSALRSASSRGQETKGYISFRLGNINCPQNPFRVVTDSWPHAVTPRQSVASQCASRATEKKRFSANPEGPSHLWQRDHQRLDIE